MFGTKVAWTERAATSIEVGLPPTPQTTGPRLTKSASRQSKPQRKAKTRRRAKGNPKPARLGAALQALGPSRATGPLYPHVHGQGQLGEPGCDPELVARSSGASPRHIPRGARAVANLGTRGGGEQGTGPYPNALRRGKPDRNPARDPPVTLLQVCSRTPPTPASSASALAFGINSRERAADHAICSRRLSLQVIRRTATRTEMTPPSVKSS